MTENVSAVIPTVGRPSLLRALKSVMEQTVPVHRIIVSVDGPAELVSGLPDDPRITVTASGERRGPNAARVAAMDLVDDGLIAFLDDDDVWSPRKTEVQLEAYRQAVKRGAEHVVVTCRTWFVRADGSPLRIPPARTMRPGQSVASYLFDRNQIRGASGAIGSSMMMFDRALADVVPFDTTLTRHEEWDWLLRVDAAHAADFVMVPDLLLGYTVQDIGASASSAGDWRTSETWVRKSADLLTNRQQAEVLLSVTVPLAMQQGEWGATTKLMAEAMGLRPSYHSLVFSVAHIPLTALRRVQALRRRG